MLIAGRSASSTFDTMSKHHFFQYGENAINVRSEIMWTPRNCNVSYDKLLHPSPNYSCVYLKFKIMMSIV